MNRTFASLAVACLLTAGAMPSAFAEEGPTTGTTTAPPSTTSETPNPVDTPVTPTDSTQLPTVSGDVTGTATAPTAPDESSEPTLEPGTDIEPSPSETAEPGEVRKPICDRYSTFTKVRKGRVQFIGVGAKIGMSNQLPTTATISQTISFSGSVSLSVKGSVTVEASVLVAGAKTTGEIGVAVTFTGGFSTTATATVPPHSMAYVQGGVFRKEFIGTGSMTNPVNCKQISGEVRVWAPYAVGFQAAPM